MTFTYENFSGGKFDEDGTKYTFGEIKVTKNETSGYTLTAKPDPGYGLKLLSIDGEEVTIKARPAMSSSIILVLAWVLQALS